MSVPTPDQKHQRLLGGRYRLHEVVGRGGMGTVWAGQDELLGRPVAVKEVLPPPNLSTSDLEQLRDRTLKEARAAARISSSAALTVHDVVEENGHPWIVMELLAPRTLGDVLRERTLSPQEAATLGLTILSALQAAEAAGVLHRDVKPANVMFRGSDDDVSRAVLTDFGIARFIGDPNITATGTLMGSPAYVAPERASGHPATLASDLWSLGVTLWTAVEGRPPFQRDGALPTLTAIVTERVPKPRNAGPLTPVLGGLLRKDPERRTGAEELRRQLQAVATGPGARRETTSGTALLTAVDPPSRRQAPAVPLQPARTRPVPVPDERPREHAAPPLAHRPDPAPPRRRPGRLAGILLALLLAGALAASLILLLDPFGGDGREVEAEPGAGSAPLDGTPSGPDPVTTGGAAATPRPDPERATAAPSETSAAEPAQGVPPGFVLHQDPTGFEVAVPQGWTADHPSASTVRFNDPESGASLLVDQTDDPKSDAVADWQAQEQAVSGNYIDYQRVGEIQGFTLRGWQGADWEFTYAADGGRGHRLNRNLITTPGEKAYALLWTTSDGQWAERRADFDTIFTSFQPVG